MIRTEHLGCGYGRCEVLHDINITMNPGELWCVLGANGVGKSTLFKTPGVSWGPTEWGRARCLRRFWAS